MKKSTLPGILSSQGVLVVQVSEKLDEDGLQDLGQHILKQLSQTEKRGVIINVSAVPLLSSYGFSLLQDMTASIALMGATAVIVGLQPGLVASLVHVFSDNKNFFTAISTEDALEIITQQQTRGLLQ